MKGLTLSAKEQKRAYVLNGILGKRWTVKEGAGLLGLSERHLWRVLAAYRKEGVAALAHGNRGRKPVNATPEEMKQAMVGLAQGPYDGANYRHVAELLAERDGLQRSRWTVRRILKAAGIGSPKRRRSRKHRRRRERYPQEGMLLQVDGSRHQWLGEEGPWWTLVGAIDDATGTVPYALFREQEDAQGYFLLLQGVIAAKGIPLALYSDRHSIFVYERRPPETLEEQFLGRPEPTQVGRALEELGIEWMGASSPQAKGRVERLGQTFQDRLRIELGLAGVKTLEEANPVLRAFLRRFNARFGVSAVQPGLAYRPPPSDLDLAGVLCFQYRRTVAGDNTLQFGGRTLQLQPTAQRSTYTRARVEVQERLDGRIVVTYQGTVLAVTDAPPGAITLRARKGPRVAPGSSRGLGVGVSPGSGPTDQPHPSAPVAGGRTQGLGVGRLGPGPEGRPVRGAKSPPPRPGPTHPWRKRLLPKGTDKIAAPIY